MALETIGTSHEGRAIPLRDGHPRATGAATDKPAYWVDGNIHSVELTASSACLYFIDWLMKSNAANNADISARTRHAHVLRLPAHQPRRRRMGDGRPARSYVRSSTRRYPFDEEPVEGLIAEDIDGDGRILQMRVADPERRVEEASAAAAALLVRRDPMDAPGGEYYRVFPEGRDRELRRRSIGIAGVTGNAQGLDLNRNFPSNWRQEFEQLGAGPLPDVRARGARDGRVFRHASEHLRRHQHPHFLGRAAAALRPRARRQAAGRGPVDLPDRRQERREELTGYPAISIWHDFQYYPGEFISGAFDWIYEHLGMYIWTIEIWNPKKEAGIDSKEWIHWFRDHPIEDDLKVFDWAQQIAPGEGHVAWKPFDHPQLGKVEIGGWNRMAIFTNPPPALREKEIARFPKWLLWQTLISPKLEMREVEVTARRRRRTWRIRLIVQNTGWLPTYVSKMALKRNLLRGVLAEIELPDGAGCSPAKPREELGELEGWAYLHTGISFWPTKKLRLIASTLTGSCKGKAGRTVQLPPGMTAQGSSRRRHRLVACSFGRCCPDALPGTCLYSARITTTGRQRWTAAPWCWQAGRCTRAALSTRRALKRFRRVRSRCTAPFLQAARPTR